MGESFFKALKWAFFVALLITGVAMLNWVEESDIRPIILVIFSFGGAYILSGPWRKLPPTQMVISILGVLALGLGAKYLPFYAYIYLGERIDMNFYVLWGVLCFVLGVPAMTYVFRKYGND